MLAFVLIISRYVKELGSLRASRSKDSTGPPSKLTQRPLERLVILQLAALRRNEAVLRARLNSTVRFELTGNMAMEISQLRDRADRLSRMIDAMV